MRGDAPTLAEIARAAGVSTPTVSKVLNGRSDVAPATRARVEELLHEHGYRRRASGPPAKKAILVMSGMTAMAYARSSKRSAAVSTSSRRTVASPNESSRRNRHQAMTAGRNGLMQHPLTATPDSARCSWIRVRRPVCSG